MDLYFSAVASLKHLAPYFPRSSLLQSCRCFPQFASLPSDIRVEICNMPYLEHSRHAAKVVLQHGQCTLTSNVLSTTVPEKLGKV